MERGQFSRRTRVGERQAFTDMTTNVPITTRINDRVASINDRVGAPVFPHRRNL